MTQPPPERVLIWDRIDSNRRQTRLFLVLFALIALPAAVYVGFYLASAFGIFLLGFGSLTGGSAAASLGLGAALAVAVLVAAVYLQLRFASAALLRLAGAREVGREEEPELRRTVENLCIGAGLPPPRLYVIESPASNAFATGLTPDSASLVVSRGLLGLLEGRELEGVVAHELVQIGNGDTRLATMTAAGVGMLRLPFAAIVGLIRFLFRIHWALGLVVLLYLGLPFLAGVPVGVALSVDLMAEEPVAGALLLAAMLLPLYVFVVAPVLGVLVRHAVLRGREYLADADALLLTRHGTGLALALAKLNAAPTAMGAGAATAHLYVVDPVDEGAPIWDRIFPTHPPVRDRLARLAAMAGGSPPSRPEPDIETAPTREDEQRSDNVLETLDDDPASS